jgi:DNA replication protein DnaC
VSGPLRERGTIVLTSNKSYGEWGSILGDPIVATAILDRLLHHHPPPSTFAEKATGSRNGAKPG